MMSNNATLWTSTEAAIVTGGTNTSQWCASGISLSLKDLKPGDLFVASREDDLEQVFKKGAAAVMLTGGVGDCVDLPALKVANTFDALQNLARAARFRTHAHIISVQGREARSVMSQVLSSAGDVHSGGRHLSLGLASVPTDCDFGVFGASPAVQPDIVVISKCSNTHRDTLFENMSKSGAVIINADDEEHLSVFARARAAGVKHIYTYGSHASADAYLGSHLEASNGVRLNVSILEESYSFTMPSGFAYEPSWLAAMLVIQLTDQNLIPCMSAFGAQCSHLGQQKSAVTLINPTGGNQHFASQAAFKVTNMIDLGYGRQTAVLDNLYTRPDKPITLKRKGLAIPDKLDSLNFVYTSKTFGAVNNAKDLIQNKNETSQVESIVADVLMPGDFVVFKDIWDNSKSLVSEVLRLVPKANYKKTKVEHAL